MHFAHTPHAAGNNSTRLALVIAFHVILGLALVKTMNTKLIARPVAEAPIDLIPTVEKPVTPPPTIAPPVSTLPQPPIVVPETEVTVTTPPLPNTVRTTTTTADPVPPTTPTTTTATQPPVTGAGTGPAVRVTMRTASMVDGCAKPAYPAQAARNGDTGTVTLALLIAADGRVTSSRIERSSGFRDLDKAALTALSRCAFKPALHGDVAEAGWAQIAFTWQLD